MAGPTVPLKANIFGTHPKHPRQPIDGLPHAAPRLWASSPGPHVVSFRPTRSHTAVLNFPGFLRPLGVGMCGSGPICRRWGVRGHRFFAQRRFVFRPSAFSGDADLLECDSNRVAARGNLYPDALVT
jgi:hypothetical protein